MALRESQAKILSCSKGLLQSWMPTTTSIRWRTRKPNIQRPIPPHWEKAKYLAVVEPFYTREEIKPWHQVCGKVLKQQEQKDVEENMYAKLLAKETLKRFQESKLVAIYHSNSTTAEENMKIRALLHPFNMRMFDVSTRTLTMALAGTQYEPVLKLLHSRTAVLYSKDLQVAKLLKLDKKMPTYILLGGFLEGRLLNRDQLTWYSKLPSLDILRAELCGILSSAASGITQSLSHHQQSLSRSLSEYTRTQSTPANENDPADKS